MSPTTLLALIALVSGSFAHADPLFDHMQGAWSATGTRRYVALPESPARVEITGHTEATVDEAGGTLTSRNRLDEIEFDNQGHETGRKSYTRDYWIRSVDGKLTYVLGGYKDGTETPIASHGVIVIGGDMPDFFQVTQDLGSGYRIESETSFTSDSESLYHEIFYKDAKRLSETRLVYTRIVKK
jgi:hypothetical protein